MNGGSILDAVLADFIVRTTIFLIQHIATRAGADDLCFMLTIRFKQRRLGAIPALFQSLWAAIIDRAIWLRRCARTLNMSVVGTRALVAAETPVFFLTGSTALCLAFLWLANPLSEYLIALMHFPWIFAEIIPGLVFLIAMRALMKCTRVLMEIPNRPYQLQRPFATLVFVMIGSAELAFIFGTRGWGHGIETVVTMWAGCIILGSFISAMDDNAFHNTGRKIVKDWGPGGRPYGKFDVWYEIPALQREQATRRAGENSTIVR
jgi:hypothetical protein